MNGMVILTPESLRVKLGEEALRDLVELLNTSSKKAKEEAVEAVSKALETKDIETKANLEKLVIETKAELRELILETQKKISDTKAEILKWMFGSWLTLMLALIATRLIR